MPWWGSLEVKYFFFVWDVASNSEIPRAIQNETLDLAVPMNHATTSPAANESQVMGLSGDHHQLPCQFHCALASASSADGGSVTLRTGIPIILRM